MNIICCGMGKNVHGLMYVMLLMNSCVDKRICSLNMLLIHENYVYTPFKSLSAFDFFQNSSCYFYQHHVISKQQSVLKCITLHYYFNLFNSISSVIMAPTCLNTSWYF